MEGGEGVFGWGNGGEEREMVRAKSLLIQVLFSSNVEEFGGEGREFKIF